MEEHYFNEIREQFCSKSPDIATGKMMSAEAIVYNKKVFAFFSTEKKMVFKLGKGFDPESMEIDIKVFNPFTKRAPLNGWFEVPYTNKEHWLPLTEKAMNVLISELHLV